MSAFSDYLESRITSWLKSSPFPSAPTTVYCGLFDGDPTDSGSGATEVTTDINTGGRVAVSYGATNDGTITNDTQVDFGASANNASVSHFGIYDSQTSGNLLFHAPLASSRSINSGDPVLFSVNNLTITVGGKLSDFMENALADWTKGTAFPSAPSDVYCALFDGDPTDTGSGGVEVTSSVNSAGRVAIPLGIPSDGSVSNNADVDFGNSDGTVSISHIGIYDAQSAGNLLIHSPLTVTRTINTGDPVKFTTGNITLTVD